MQGYPETVPRVQMFLNMPIPVTNSIGVKQLSRHDSFLFVRCSTNDMQPRDLWYLQCVFPGIYGNIIFNFRTKSSGAKTIKKNTNSTQNKFHHRAKQYEVTSFLSTDCELSTETCSKNVYSLGPWSLTFHYHCLPFYPTTTYETRV